MRIAVLGATGHTGQHVVELALRRGHDVTAFVRSPGKLAARPRLTIVKGNPLEAMPLAAALAGQDAVISVFGPPGREALKPATLVTDYAHSVVTAMRRAGVTRLAIISAAVLFPQRGLVFRFFRWFLRHHARDLAAMEREVQASELAWTIARPGRLVEAADATYRTADGAFPARGRAMSFAAVAAFFVDAVEHQAHVRQIVGLAR
jgi:putative NADH-flavin reductase